MESTLCDVVFDHEGSWTEHCFYYAIVETCIREGGEEARAMSHDAIEELYPVLRENHNEFDEVWERVTCTSGALICTQQ